MHHPERYHVQLTSLGQRLAALEEMGMDATLLVRYTLPFSKLSPEEFVKEYFVDLLHARAVVVGEDARFGAGNSGDEQTLRDLGERYGFEAVVLRDLVDPESGRRWSSTWVREALSTGDVETAATVLGRPHLVRGEVVHGAKRGRQLGYPTANLDTDDIGVVPADGVYAGWLTDGGSGIPPPSPWEPTRPSTGTGGASRPTCSGGTTSTCTTTWSRWSSPTGSGRCSPSTASRACSTRWPTTSPAPPTSSASPGPPFPIRPVHRRERAHPGAAARTTGADW